jgi:glycine/D-amino acid oxidase-like deaminating enzyme
VKLASYWHETAPRFDAAVQGPPSGRADVVVGGGFTGLSAALALAKKGAQVVLLEAERVGGAASGRNGGHVNNGFAQDYAAMCARLGTERANLLYRSFDAGVDTVARIIVEARAIGRGLHDRVKPETMKAWCSIGCTSYLSRVRAGLVDATGPACGQLLYSTPRQVPPM